jgi:hypothetical protein
VVGYQCELVVIGGSGLLALGVIDRATRDVDLLALLLAMNCVRRGRFHPS